MADLKGNLKDILQFERQLQKDGLAPRSALHLHNTAARFTLDQDLGHAEGSSQVYDLDEATRDRLLAHARQDAALAAFLISGLDRRIARVERLIYVVLALLLFVAFQVYQ